MSNGSRTLEYCHSAEYSLEIPDAVFERFRRIIYDTAGIALNDGKKELLRARLGKIMRKRKIPSFREYLRLVEEDETGDEIVILLDAISTNLTFFFREQEHFRFLENEALPSIRSCCEAKGTKKIRAWSAGCSTGEEPYSLALSLLEELGGEFGWDVRILATDLSTRVIGIARNGAYGSERVRNVDTALLGRYFNREEMDGRTVFRIRPEVRKIITFDRLNLLEPYPFRGPFDFIFCRNVMIYFDRQTQETLIGRFHDYLAEGGYLFIGHSESLSGVSHPFDYIQPSVYRKKAGAPRRTRS